MKPPFTRIAAPLLLIFCMGVGLSFMGVSCIAVSSASAANLDGHMKYTIISYSFNGGENDILSEAGKDSLLITGTSLDILSEDMINPEDYSVGDPRPVTDIIAVSAGFAATPDLSLQGTFGFSKNQEDFNLDLDYNHSWEANVGVIYQLFNNIRYEVHFGYMETGDLFKNTSSYSDVESIIMISNKLSMSF